MLVYKQPTNFTAPADYKTQDQIKEVSNFDFQKYVKDANLTEIVGSTFFTVVQPGQTQSVKPTPTATQNITAPTDGTSNGSNSTGTQAQGNGTNSAGNSTSSNPAETSKPGAGFQTTKVSVFAVVLGAAVAALL